MKDKVIDFSFRLIFYLFLVLLPGLIKAQNPISPPGIYLADPSARSWNDSILYLYTSTDLSCDFWCSWKHDILSTTDMKIWNVASDVFASDGKNDEVLYNDKLLFAPDCAKKGNNYILYYCQPDNNNALGTALGESAIGPFENGQILNTGEKYSQIDPSVFIDEDSTAYVVWGQGDMKMGILNPDMRTIDTNTIRDKVITVSEHYFHEGAYMTKRNGIYYLVYADESRNKVPSCLGYATSDNPFGPYIYRGVIIDNSGCNPGNWNNHGSIFNFQDQWYVFYHRSTHGCQMFRKSCVEKIQFLSDGSIPEVEMTTQGALPPLDATKIIDAERACSMKGNVRIEKESESNEILSEMKGGDQVVYRYLDFSAGVNRFSLKYRALGRKGTLLLYVEQGGQRRKIAEIKLEESKESAWVEESFKVKKTKGIAELIFEVSGDGSSDFEIDWFRFAEKVPMCHRL
ncbi:family 43 glycosylhydrolase [Sunxiuqinia elliptica]|uniref:family 43 glycosylhydrolase n=1 Tax=Sunxiuqinia elliptica TaxID=655355 RepID=UPI00147D5A69|nr:family 43 glycosylhydrolase [Sunxiuqinia elliptica]